MKLIINITLLITCFFVFFNAFARDINNAPFFLVGDGKVNLKNTHNGREININYLKEDGSLNDEAFKKVDYLFGFPTNQKRENISKRLVAMLDYFTDKVAPGKKIYLTSGYRSPEYNKKIRDRGANAAKTSTHIDGMALDFYLEGRSASQAKALWEMIRKLDCCGAGHYGGKNVHLDAGRPRFWQAATSKVRTKEPAHNRFIYYSTEYDRYKAGERFRSFFTSISDFGFGIKNKLVIVTDDEKQKKVASIKISSLKKSSCLLINEREDARFIYSELPQTLQPGRYRIRVDFCKIPFEDMPKEKVSNPIEIIR